MSITFQPAERPTIPRVGRPKQPNPYDALAKYLAADMDATATLDAPLLEGKTVNGSLAYALRKIHEAGTDHGVTIRVVGPPVSEPDSLTITAWAVPAIKRARKAPAKK